jgi:hypothetical protein
MTIQLKFGVKHLLVLMVVAASAVQLILWEPWEEPRYRRSTLSALNRLEKQLESELLDPRHVSWAGVYSCEDEFYDLTLTIAPKVGWLMERRTSAGCFVHSDFNFGRCTVEKDCVELTACLNDPRSPRVLVIDGSFLNERANDHNPVARRWKIVDGATPSVQN